MSNTLPVPITEDVNSCGSAQLQELNDLKEILKIIRNKYIKYKIIHDAVQETAQNSNMLDSELKIKVQDILMKDRCAPVTDLKNGDFSVNPLFGLTYLDSVPLYYKECNQLKDALVLVLQKKYKNLQEQFCLITDENINHVETASNELGNINLNRDEQSLVELKAKLEEEQRRYHQNLLKEHRILEDLTKLRLEKLPEACNKKVTECQLKSQINAVQAKFLQEKTRVEIFTETSNSLAAYNELLKDIDKQQEDCQRNIQMLKELKKKYDRVSCKQYDELLKSFIHFKSSLERMKMIYESLHG